MGFNSMTKKINSTVLLCSFALIGCASGMPNNANVAVENIVIDDNLNLELEYDKDLIKATNTHYRSQDSKCELDSSFIKTFKTSSETWRICEPEKGVRIIEIESFQEPTLYNEVYFELNDQLVYAVESELYKPNNLEILQGWVCEFYIKDGKLITSISTGHGKTERDDWDPKVILEMYIKRLDKLNDIQTIKSSVSE